MKITRFPSVKAAIAAARKLANRLRRPVKVIVPRGSVAGLKRDELATTVRLPRETMRQVVFERRNPGLGFPNIWSAIAKAERETKRTGIPHVVKPSGSGFAVYRAGPYVRKHNPQWLQGTPARPGPGGFETRSFFDPSRKLRGELFTKGDEARMLVHNPSGVTFNVYRTSGHASKRWEFVGRFRALKAARKHAWAWPGGKTMIREVRDGRLGRLIPLGRR